MPISYYIFITFAPVQGFIEKSRKLRDLYGASQILSYLSQVILDNIEPETIISPGAANIAQGIPNRIVFKVVFDSDENAGDRIETLVSSLHCCFSDRWQCLLTECRTWIEQNLTSFDWYWQEEWGHWANHSWEFFWGYGTTLALAMQDIENRKLSRNWTGINWVGESSSITGTDAIAFPNLGGRSRKPKQINWAAEDEQIKAFYRQLAVTLDGRKNPQPETGEPEGKYIAANERLSIPELAKRLVTLPEIAETLEMPAPQKFTDIVRKTDAGNGQWTGWVMGDGDRVGDYLKCLASRENGDTQIREFSTQMTAWGEQFYGEVGEIIEDSGDIIGRTIYAGGDDFLSILYNPKFADIYRRSLSGQQIIEWLKNLRSHWETGKSEDINHNVTLSIGFVWAAPGVPQRDVLQHCREAEKRSKSLGRDRITIRVVFNSGQFVQWTCPWQCLELFEYYRDRDGGKNWSHIYGDLAHLKSRHAIPANSRKIPEEFIDDRMALKLYELYFTHHNIHLELNPHLADLSYYRNEIVGSDSSLELVRWINNLITVGWHLCSDP